MSDSANLMESFANQKQQLDESISSYALAVQDLA
jgi:hypothetical protein